MSAGLLQGVGPVVGLVFADTWRIVRSRWRVPTRLWTLWAAWARHTWASRWSRSLVVVVGLVLVVWATVEGWVDALGTRFSLIETLVLLVAVALAGGLLRRGRTARILPFRNLSGDELEVLSIGAAELFDEQVRRINHLLSLDVFDEPVEVRGQRPSGSTSLGSWRASLGAPQVPTHLPFRSGVAVSGAFGEIPTEVASLDVGPLHLSIGTLLNLYARFWGQAVAGTVSVADGRLLVSAGRSARRGGKWSIHSQRPLADDIEDGGVGVVRDLVHRMLWDELGTTDSADARSFQLLLNGIEAYDRFRSEGRTEELRNAAEWFEQAVVVSPHYAAAHHNLGVVLQQLGRLDQAGGASEAQAAVARWSQAVSLDSGLAAAWLQMASVACMQQRFGDGADFARRARDAARDAPPMSPLRIAAHYWLGRALLDGAVVGDGTELVDVAELEKALRALELARQELLDIRTDRILHRVGGPALAPVDLRLAKVVAAQVEARRLIVGRLRAEQPRLGRARLGRAQLGRAQLALRWADDHDVGNGELYFQRALLLDLQGQMRDAERAALKAVRVEPGDTDLLIEIADFLSQSEHHQSLEAAGRMLQLGVTRAPDNPALWSLVAQFERWEGRPVAARAVAAMTYAIAPLTERQRHALEDLLDPSLTDAWAEAWGTVWRSAEEHFPAAVEVAVQICDTYRETHPETCLADYRLGLMHLDLVTLELTDDESAMRLRARDHLGRAESYLRSLLAGVSRRDELLSTLHAAVLLDLANVCLLTGEEADRDRARWAFGEVLALQPEAQLVQIVEGPGDVAWLRSEIGDISIRAQALTGLGETEPDQAKAQAQYREALADSPRFAYPHYLLYETHLDRAEFVQAATELAQLARIVPDWAADHALEEGRLLRLRALEIPASPARTALLESAMASLRRVFTLSPTLAIRVASRVAMAEILTDLAQADAAVVEMRTAARLGAGQAGDSGRRYELAIRLEESGELPEAEAEYHEALDLAEPDSPDEALAANGLAWFLTEQRARPEEARQVAERAVRAARSSGTDLGNCLDTRGWAAFRCGDLTAAHDDIRDAICHGENDERWFHYALIVQERARQSDDPDVAAQEFARAAEIFRHIRSRYPASRFADRAENLGGDPATKEYGSGSLLHRVIVL